MSTPTDAARPSGDNNPPPGQGDANTSATANADSNANTNNASNNDTDPDPDPLIDAASPQGGRGSMSSFIFMSIMLFMLTNGGGEDFMLRQQYRDSLQTLRAQQANFSSWLWAGGNAAVNASEGNFTLVCPA